MSKLPLTFACGLYDRMLALYTGEVQPEGIELNFLPIDNPREIFDRMGRGFEFDLCEMSSSETFTRLMLGETKLAALPVFPSRVFRHGHVTINRRSGIKSPKDLEGKRVGVPFYTQTAAVFIRGFLQHEYKVDLSKVHWIQGAMDSPGAHGDPAIFPLLKPVDMVQNKSGKSLSDLLAAGEIDAITAAGVPKSLGKHPDVQRLFPNFREVERDYYKRTKIFPIMHLVAIKREVYERHPFIATSLFNAFERAKERALAKLHSLGTLRAMLPWLSDDLDEIDQVFGGDCWPYGIEANRPTLEALVTYLHEQHIIAKAPKLEELFLPVYGAGSH